MRLALLDRLLERDGDADGWVRPAPTPRQVRVDVLVAVLLAAGCIASSVLGRSVGSFPVRYLPGHVETVAWCLAVSLPLAVRRRRPLTSAIAVAAAFIGLQARWVPEQQVSAICLFLALFTAGAWGGDRQVTTVVRGAIVLVMFAWLTYWLATAAWTNDDVKDAAGPIAPRTAAVIYAAGINVLYFGGALAFGTMAWRRARQDFLLGQRNAELALERDRNARQAVVAERLRIAQELHDVVAHHVSLMGIQASAARRVLDRDVDLARRTLTDVEASGRLAVEEMHGLLGVLRSQPSEPGTEPGTEPAQGGSAEQPGVQAPAPTLDRLEELVVRARAAGLRTELTVVGEPRPVPGGVSVSAYRIVQEALTNTVRHAGASRADVRLRYLDGAVEVEVVDDGRAHPAPAATASGTGTGGMGHIGMRERVAVHGGELEVGPRPEGGYRVRARLPVPARSRTTAGTAPA